jgi:GTP cyclohydrolase II
MLVSRKIKSIRLMTKKPRKISDLTRNGVLVRGRILVIIPPNSCNEFYLKTKAEKSGHFLDTHHKLHLQQHGDMPLMDGMTDSHIAEMQQEQIRSRRVPGNTKLKSGRSTASGPFRTRQGFA